MQSCMPLLTCLHQLFEAQMTAIAMCIAFPPGHPQHQPPELCRPLPVRRGADTADHTLLTRHAGAWLTGEHEGHTRLCCQVLHQVRFQCAIYPHVLHVTVCIGTCNTSSFLMVPGFLVV